MYIQPADKARAYVSKARCEQEAQEFLGKLFHQDVLRNKVHWMVVPIMNEVLDQPRRWTVIVALMTDDVLWSARKIAEHGWKVLG